MRKTASPKQYFRNRPKYILADSLSPDLWPHLRGRAVIPPECGKAIEHYLKKMLVDLRIERRGVSAGCSALSKEAFTRMIKPKVEQLDAVITHIEQILTKPIRSISWSSHVEACK